MNLKMIVFFQIRNRLGGRIRLIVSGGAPLSPEVEEFLRVTSCAFVLQGYGMCSLMMRCNIICMHIINNRLILYVPSSYFVYPCISG